MSARDPDKRLGETGHPRDLTARDRPEGRLEEAGRAPDLAPEHEPPESAEGRQTEWVADHDTRTRDIRPATGERGGPASWTPAVPGADVGLARRGFGDSRWSFLYKERDTRYAPPDSRLEDVAAANLRMRSAPVPDVLGPFIKSPVWTWEVPLYFWVGGVASGSGFVALACDVAGDQRSAAVARKVALAAVAPAPLLLIADLGRPGRFLNMMRVFKPRSPMNMGAWCLVAFSTSTAAAVGADLIGRPKAARALGALTGLLGGYLGSYTGVLLACTAVPLWARSRTMLGPIFVATASATGAAATRLTLVACGLPEDHPTRSALGTVETASILAELSLSAINERRVGAPAHALVHGHPGRVYRTAQALVLMGLSSRLIARRTGPRVHDLASLLYLAGGMAFRFAWVQAGRQSATDHEAAAAVGRGRYTLEEERELPRVPHAESASRTPFPLPSPSARRAWPEVVRRTSLAVERLLRS